MSIHPGELKPAGGTVLIEGIVIGMCRSASKVIGDTEIEVFAALSSDRNPVHLNDEYARGTVFEGRIAHGMLTAWQWYGVFAAEFDVLCTGSAG